MLVVQVHPLAHAEVGHAGEPLDLGSGAGGFDSRPRYLAQGLHQGHGDPDDQDREQERVDDTDGPQYRVTPWWRKWITRLA